MKVEDSKKEQLILTDIKIKEINENTQLPNDLSKSLTSSMVLSIKASQMDPDTKIEDILKSLSDKKLDLTQYTQKFLEEGCHNLEVLIEMQFSVDDFQKKLWNETRSCKKII